MAAGNGSAVAADARAAVMQRTSVLVALGCNGHRKAARTRAERRLR